jgi:RNA polymerase sigma-70 factor (ECF subfamily)
VGCGALPQVAASPRTTEVFASIYQEHFGYVWHTLRRLGVPRRELADVTHNVFLVIYHRYSSYDAARPLRPWIFGVAFRVAADYLRLARHARETVRNDLDVSDQGPAADDILGEKQEQSILREALASLDLDRRAVVVAHDIDGVGGTEIAQALGIPLKTMYYRLRTGREQLVASVRRIRAKKGNR